MYPGAIIAVVGLGLLVKPLRSLRVGTRSCALLAVAGGFLLAGAGLLLPVWSRVFASGASARRRFAVYWRMIYPGSAIIRRMWLRAIERRATGEDASRLEGFAMDPFIGKVL